MEYIKIQKKDIYRLGLADEDGNPKLDENGNEMYLEFDLADINLPFRWQECEEKIRLARESLRNKFLIIDKKQDHKGKKLMSYREEAKMEELKKYYKEMEKAMDLFLGEGGTQKVFDDRRYWEMFDDLAEWLQPHMKDIKLDFQRMQDRMKMKYEPRRKESVLKDE